MGHSRFLGTRPRPACPRHPDSKVWKDGSYGRPDNRRPRYRCFPRDDLSPHVFTEMLPRKRGSGECPHCERPIPSTDGAPTPRRYRYEVRSIASTLIELGKGMSYRSAAKQIRLGAGGGGADWKLAADWLETFAPCLYLADRETVWPRYVMLDALPFRLTMRRGGRGRSNANAFTVLAAMGQDSYGAGLSSRRVLALRAYPGRSTLQQRGDWIDFLSHLKDELSGPPPEEFIVDMDAMISRAIKSVWPEAECDPPAADPKGPVVWWCHWHLAQVLRSHVANEGFGLGTPLQELAGAALRSRSDWDDFERAIFALRGRFRGLKRYLRRISPKAIWQIEHRHRYVLANGALESYLKEVRSALNDRRGRLQNRERLNRLLMLMVLQANGKASVPHYSKLIRSELELNGGFGMPRRQIGDPAGAPSLRA